MEKDPWGWLTNKEIGEGEKQLPSESDSLFVEKYILEEPALLLVSVLHGNILLLQPLHESQLALLYVVI